MADFLTYKNIYEAIQRLVKVTKGSKQTMIKEAINQVYSEMLVADDLYPLFWLKELDDSLNAKAPAVVSGITAADPGVATTDAAHGFTDGDLVSLHSIVGMVELNHRLVQVGTVPTATTFKLEDLDGSDLDTSGYTAYTSGGVVNHRGFKLATTGKNVNRILVAGFHGYDPLDKADPTELEGTTQFWGAETTRPTKYYHRKKFTTAGVETNHLVWLPGADQAYDFRYWLEQRCSPLSADGDVPLLPPRFHYTIISGTLVRLITTGAQVENASIWPALYKGGLGAMIAHNRRFYEGEDKEQRPYLL